MSIRIAALAGLVACAGASASQIVVNAEGVAGWSTDQGAVDFVAGPGSAPGGNGSLSMHTGIAGPKNRFGTGNFDGTTLSSSTELSYWTYVDGATPGNTVAPSLNVQIQTGSNIFGPTYTTLVYEPYYAGGLSKNTWQQWDALGSSNAWWVTGSPNTFLSWTDVLAQFGDKEIQSGTSFFNSEPGFVLQTGQNSAGAPWAGFVGYADMLTFGTGSGSTTFDFEPESVVIPLPTGAGLAAFGLGIVALRRRR